MAERKKINILLLGESGTGKSTFINSFYNYLHGNLEEAQKSNLKWLVPTSFSMTDENFNVVKVKLSNSNDESDIAGQAATKFPKTYALNIKDKLDMQIIDTPGIGDPEGFKKDQENFSNILKHISSLENLHGICILLKPNVSRLSLQFRYCFKELMVHLHKSAVPNIVFCFTNTRGTFFQPGETIIVLKALLNQIESESGIKIPISKDNVFCFENESFRYLAASKQGATFSATEKGEFMTSWILSVKSTLSMLSYISSLEIHDLTQTINLNKARTVLYELARPIAEITQNIQINLKLANDNLRELHSNDNIVNDLNKLYITQVDYEPIKLCHPRTVCTHSKCVKMIRIGLTNKVDYATHCHPHCYLTDVEREVINNEKLKDCACMIHRKICKICSHDWSKHMHITYENKKVEKKQLSRSLQDAFNKHDNKNTLQIAVMNATKLIDQLKQEQQEIIKISSKFARFTNKNSILPFNTDLCEYLDLLIREEEGINASGFDNGDILKGLREAKQNFESQKIILKDNFNTNADDSTEDIDKLLNDLFDLPLSGQKIKKTVETLKNIMKLQ